MDARDLVRLAGWLAVLGAGVLVAFGLLDQLTARAREALP